MKTTLNNLFLFFFLIAINGCAFVPRTVDIANIDSRINTSQEYYQSAESIEFSSFSDKRPDKNSLGVARNKLMMVTTSVSITGNLQNSVERLTKNIFAAQGMGEGKSRYLLKGSIIDAKTDAFDPNNIYVQIQVALSLIDKQDNNPIFTKKIKGYKVTPVTQVSNSAWEDAFFGALNEIGESIETIAIDTKKIILASKQDSGGPNQGTRTNKSESIGIIYDHIWEVPAFNTKKRPNDLSIIIGIENYQSVPRADYAKNDAALFKKYLLALGFEERNIEYIADEKATKSGIEKAVEAWLPNNISRNSKVIIYFSGHGSPNPSNGEPYVLPYDGDPNYLSITGYPLNRLYENLAKLQAREIIVVIDACFSGSGGRSVIAKGVRPIVMEINKAPIAKNIIVLSSTTGAQISTSSPDKKLGVFTYYLLKAIQDGKGNVYDIYNYIKPLIENEAKALNVTQSPWISHHPNQATDTFNIR